MHCILFFTMQIKTYVTVCICCGSLQGQQYFAQPRVFRKTKAAIVLDVHTCQQIGYGHTTEKEGGTVG